MCPTKRRVVVLIIHQGKKIWPGNPFDIGTFSSKLCYTVSIYKSTHTGSLVCSKTCILRARYSFTV